MSEKFESLVEKLSDACHNHELDIVMASALCIAEQAIVIVAGVTENFTTNLKPVDAVGYGLTAQRLEYLAKVLRGEQPEDPHEDLMTSIDKIQEQDDETTH